MQQDDNVDFYNPGNHSSDNTPGPGPEDDRDNSQPTKNRAHRMMNWNAPEYLEIERGAGWYAGLAFATLALASLLYLTSKDYFAVSSIIILGVIVAIFVGRKPRIVEYQLSDSGIEIGQKHYSYGLFKSFTVVRDANLNSVELLPLKRFMLPVSALFAPEDENKVVEIIGEHLPYAEHKPGYIDKLSQRLRL
jgi:hypothetical protein